MQLFHFFKVSDVQWSDLKSLTMLGLMKKRELITLLLHLTEQRFETESRSGRQDVCDRLSTGCASLKYERFKDGVGSGMMVVVVSF